MKRCVSMCILLTAAACGLPAGAYSSGTLSPALDILAEQTCMVCTGLGTGEITFSQEDFDMAVGSPVSSVTVTALPPRSDGTLYYGAIPVSIGQIFHAGSLEALHFVPEISCRESSFRFKTEQDYSMPCRLRFTDQVNTAPVAAQTAEDALTVWTQTDIASYGVLAGRDAENDALSFQILQYPERGLLELLDISAGTYTYTPFDGVHGDDHFSYIVQDEWGHFSNPVTVDVTIDEAACDLVFADMNGHWAHNAALVMAASQAMEMESVGDSVYFHPEENISREDFLVTVMKVLGAGELQAAETPFADHEDIAEEASGYIARAYAWGIVRGIEEQGDLYFKPKASVTRAEAAVMLNAILGAEAPDVVPVFADSSSLPVWASSSMYALSQAGIFKGTGNGNLSPNEVLSRAQAAQILLAVKKTYG